ncbi:hypothetical protein HF086_002984 [Spodoptera exigua]|uniref:Copper homeostasis protein cutC homolog n=1 Tax=Spodoptera exigua TaxID=7107 RepID=A0A922MU76_SPOEX|nr:hypothetical protein HF086_002984 [Spodoptera exigua]
MLEVCIDSLESAINAIHGGADELEVCSSLTEGGLTPSPGLVKEIVKMRAKVNVMIRCRTGSDFCYSEQEMDTMLSDVEVFKAYGADRFVFGALTDSQDVDEKNCERIINQAGTVPVTFHRAFDVCADPLSAVNKISTLGFNRLLTSGQKSTANDIEAIQLIKALNNTVGDKIEIMPGAGVTVENAKNFIDIGCKIVHSSCKRIRYLPQIKKGLSMGTSDSEHVFVSDENIVRKMKEVITYD